MNDVYPRENLAAWVRLNLVEGMGVQKKLDLLRLYESPSAIFEADSRKLTAHGLHEDIAASLLSDQKKNEAEAIVLKAQGLGIDIIPLDHDTYPEMLKYIHDPPLVLYARGSIPTARCIAVVGSRRASGYGSETAFKLSQDLAGHDCVVVSGMARGIDTAAHSGALNAGGKTVAVLGCGVDYAYPPENKGLMERIIQSGAVISEYPPGVGPAAYHFPTRNRIISGMSFGVLVVEAGQKSGSLITAQIALEQGREVFAVPGNINHIYSYGTNHLIKDGAKLVTSVEDILEEIPWQLSYQKKDNGKPDELPLDSVEKRVTNLLKIEDLYHEQIAEKMKMKLPDLISVLLSLELKGAVIKDLTGKYRIVSR